MTLQDRAGLAGARRVVVKVGSSSISGENAGKIGPIVDALAEAHARGTEVVRAPGPKGKKPAVVYRGKGRRLVDKGVQGNRRYWYQVRLFDRAGNVSSRTLPVRPATGILAPVPGAVLHAAPLVRWAPVRKARFYNVQLWRGSKKLLTTWPNQPLLRLEDTSRFGGKRLRLTNGAYRVYVWPAFGTLAQPRYGAPVGHVKFAVRRR